MTKELFCKTIEFLREYYDDYRKLEKLFETDFSDSNFSLIMDIIVDLLRDSLKIESNSLWGDDLMFYCWELDFGRKWQPGAVLVDDKEFPLETPEELWDFIHVGDYIGRG